MDEFAEMVQAVRNARQIAGDVFYGPTAGEKSNLKFRRSLFAVRDINAGETITNENVRSIRPATGLKPKFLSEIIGKTASENVGRGTPFSKDFVK